MLFLFFFVFKIIISQFLVSCILVIMRNQQGNMAEQKFRTKRVMYMRDKEEA